MEKFEDCFFLIIHFIQDTIRTEKRFSKIEPECLKVGLMILFIIFQFHEIYVQIVEDNNLNT